MLILLEGHMGLSPEPLSAMPLDLLLSNTSTSQTDNMQERRSIIGIFKGEKEVFLCLL